MTLHHARQAAAKRLYLILNNGRIRDELLNESPFVDLGHTRRLIRAWVADYNTARPHSSLGYKTPMAYAEHLIAPKGATPAAAPVATA